MKIKAEDYLSKEEIREIIKEELREGVKKDVERIISNTSYFIVRKFTDQFLDKNDIKLLNKKIKKVITELSPYTVFYKPDVYDRSNQISLGYAEMDKAVEKHKSLIEKRIKEIILSDNFYQQLEYSSQNFVETLIKMYSNLKEATNEKQI